MPFSNEQLRLLENLAVGYDEWLRTARTVPSVDGWLHWKTVGDKQYLYWKQERSQHGKSLGRRGPETEQKYAEYRGTMDERQGLLARLKSLQERTQEYGRMYRSLRLPLVDHIGGAVLRELDVRGMLGSALMVVGTNTMAAYQLEAQTRFPSGLDATQDFDFAWTGDEKTALALTGEHKTPLLDALKFVDDTFVTNTERTFQARNEAAYEIDILCAPSVYASYPKSETLRPVPLAEQEWLLKGKPVSQIVCDRNNMPVRIVAPDPRWMALHKLWLAEKPGRNRKKIRKDREQGETLLQTIAEHMPHYRIDAAFASDVPDKLRRYLPAAVTGDTE